ncbi:MAG: glycosyltransferase [Candidatus Kerfeldbacteria bacterium]|nr:glycosyltransferase [Candidatus Kerfeldbacteria bacterium]
MEPSTETRSAKIAVLIPCYNEAVTIKKVIEDFRRELPTADIVVVDNNSTDASVEIARTAGARVIFERRQGKGNVVKKMFDDVDADYYVMVDADDTYHAADVHKLLAPAMEDKADMVVGTRLEAITQTSMNLVHQFGNRMLLGIINFSFRSKLRDLLSGYRMMNRSYVEGIPVLSTGFEIETELALQAMERGFRVIEVPVAYQARPEGSESKLRPLRDGAKILFTIMSILRDYRPMTFFPAVAIILLLASVGTGLVVFLDYLEKGLVTRLPLALITVGLAITSLLVLIAGFIVSTINRRFEENHILLFRLLKKKKPQ